MNLKNIPREVEILRKKHLSRKIWFNDWIQKTRLASSNYDGAPIGNDNAKGPHKRNGSYPKDPKEYEAWCHKRKIDPKAAKQFTKELKGKVASNGIAITQVRSHAAYRMKHRKLDTKAVEDILKTAPIQYPTIHRGGDATVFQKDMNKVVFGKNGHIITVITPDEEDD